jgi:hypothetical protein
LESSHFPKQIASANTAGVPSDWVGQRLSKARVVVLEDTLLKLQNPRERKALLPELDSVTAIHSLPQIVGWQIQLLHSSLFRSEEKFLPHFYVGKKT